MWFSVQHIKKIELASEPAQGLFSYADVAWIKLLRDLFLRGKPRQQVAPALRYLKRKKKPEKKIKEKTNFYHFPKQLSFISMVLSSFL